MRVKNPNDQSAEAEETAEDEKFMVPQGIGVKRKLTDVKARKGDGESEEKRTKMDGTSTEDEYEFEDEGTFMGV